MKGIAIILTAAFVLIGTMGIGLCGCSSESRGVKIHRPGAYKGVKDPLLYLKNHQALIDRQKLVQMAR